MTIKYNANYKETMPFSDTSVQVNLGAAVAQLFTVPGTDTAQYQAYFEYASNSNVFVCLNSAPVSPTAGSVSAQPYSEFRPKKRYVRGGDVLHFITPDTVAYVGVSLRQLQG
jgi:hypothetical protein